MPSLEATLDHLQTLSDDKFKAALGDGSLEATLMRHGMEPNSAMWWRWVDAKITKLSHDAKFLLSLKKYIHTHPVLLTVHEPYIATIEIPLVNHPPQFFVDHRMDVALLGTETKMVEILTDVPPGKRVKKEK